jgi:hypothetical protein
MIGVSTLHQAPKALEHKCFKTKHVKEISETQFQNRSTNQKHGATGEEMHHPTWLLPEMHSLNNSFQPKVLTLTFSSTHQFTGHLQLPGVMYK